MIYKAQFGRLNGEEAEIAVDIGCTMFIANRAFIEKHCLDIKIKIIPTII